MQTPSTNDKIIMNLLESEIWTGPIIEKPSSNNYGQ
jgi:hypothetical protein